MEHIGYIYMHKNKINGKIYIGQTCQKPEYRWNHGEGYKDSPLFYNAVKKYGWDNFEHIILEDKVPIKLLNNKEEYYINKYKSGQREFGYNLTSGGTGKLNKEQKDRKKELLREWRRNNPKQAEKSIKKMQEYWINHPEEKQKVMKKATKESIKYWNEHPEEKQKVMKKMHDRAKIKNIKPVKCVETNKIYESAREAYRQTGVYFSSIGKVCKGKQKTAGGFHWVFIEKEI